MANVAGNFTITRGDTYKENWVIKDESGTPINITGGKLYFTLKNSVSDPDPGALQLTSATGEGITITDAPNGAATMTMTSAQTAALNVQTYYYDIQYKSSSGEIFTLARGTMTVESDVTQSTS